MVYFERKSMKEKNKLNKQKQFYKKILLILALSEFSR